MIKLLKSFFNKIATTSIFYFVVVLFIASSSYMIYLITQIFSIYPKILDLEMFGYSKETILHTFEFYGQEGMLLYKKVQITDIFYPFIGFLFLGSIISKIYNNRGFWIYILLLLAMGSDYCENYYLWSFRESYPLIDMSLVSISSVFSIMKHSSILLMVFLGTKNLILKNNI